MAYLTLCFRAFSEVVIVGQLDRSPAHLQTIAFARDVTYGLFSLCFVALIAWVIPTKGEDDHLIQAKESAMQNVKQLVISKLERKTHDGTKTAPPVSELFNEVRGEIKAESPRRTHLASELVELERLKLVFARWEPVYKEQEANSELYIYP
jgi:hypothetical protein